MQAFLLLFVYDSSDELLEHQILLERRHVTVSNVSETMENVTYFLLERKQEMEGISFRKLVNFDASFNFSSNVERMKIPLHEFIKRITFQLTI